MVHFIFQLTKMNTQKNRIVLNSLINDKNGIKGIVMMSAFSLPEDKQLRKKIYKDLIKRKKKTSFHFREYFV